MKGSLVSEGDGIKQCKGNHLPHPRSRAVPKQFLRTNSSPQSFADHNVFWRGISLWPVQDSCPGTVPAQFLVQTKLWAGRDRAILKEIFNTVQALFSRSQNTDVLAALLYINEQWKVFLPMAGRLERGGLPTNAKPTQTVLGFFKPKNWLLWRKLASFQSEPRQHCMTLHLKTLASYISLPWI